MDPLGRAGLLTGWRLCGFALFGLSFDLIGLLFPGLNLEFGYFLRYLRLPFGPRSANVANLDRGSLRIEEMIKSLYIVHFRVYTLFSRLKPNCSRVSCCCIDRCLRCVKIGLLSRIVVFTQPVSSNIFSENPIDSAYLE